MWHAFLRETPLGSAHPLGFVGNRRFRCCRSLKGRPVTNFKTKMSRSAQVEFHGGCHHVSRWGKSMSRDVRPQGKTKNKDEQSFKHRFSKAKPKDFCDVTVLIQCLEPQPWTDDPICGTALVPPITDFFPKRLFAMQYFPPYQLEWLVLQSFSHQDYCLRCFQVHPHRSSFLTSVSA